MNLLNSQTAIGVVRELLLSFEREVQRKLEWVYGTQSRLDVWVDWDSCACLELTKHSLRKGTGADPRASTRGFVHSRTTPQKVGFDPHPNPNDRCPPPTLSDCSHPAYPTHPTRLNYPLSATLRSSFLLIPHSNFVLHLAGSGGGSPSPTSQPASILRPVHTRGRPRKEIASA